MMSEAFKPLTPSELADLKAKAKAATRGPWEKCWKTTAIYIRPSDPKYDGPDIARIVSHGDRDGNAAHILAANLETILRLIAMIEGRDEQIEKLRAGLSYHGAHDGGCPGGSYCTCGYTEALSATEPPK